MSAKAVCLGELLIDFVPTVTGTGLADAPAFAKAAGGAPGNVAVGLQRLGIETGFIGKLGDDAFGHFLVDTLKADNVDTSGIVLTKEALTGLAFVSLRADGEREFSFYRSPSADMLLTPADLDQDMLKGCDLFHYGTLCMIDDDPRAATLAAIDIARENGAIISCDPNLRLPLWPNPDAARDMLRLAITKADVVKISDDEVAFITGKDDLEAGVRELWCDHWKLMIVTSGPKGSRFFTPDFEGAAKPFKVTAVDATGAGDGFTAGFLSRLLKDPELLTSAEKVAAACRFANAVGAMTATKRGAIAALPTEAEVAQFLSVNGLPG
ncbi:fructokinase [Thalassospira xiamenensis M-5 = DSM 17429]|uniref:Fructokinase n=1 Tax=Thalassospira xiamenensis M-5 = DSM 17429 TaxID=1123366 RepID=A0AB72UDG6_9PROT|nr:PfkB family carbohydrate kinase [Thalassospira xiamenensis]AJD52271.1 putative fructokinase [Thalassospira xiamenensis M-5 = DSM 17429]SIS88156.1 fructokinase [Thalassospira xiamenensis M-5 = DSM 17429]